MKISLCLIVRDEEDVLARCLQSASPLADEIVIADTGSHDGTLAIARQFTQNIYSFPWKDDFAAARNFAFSKASGDYLFWLDADDVLSSSEEDRAQLEAMLERSSPDMVYFPYVSGGVRFYRERLLKREMGYEFVGRVHECIPPKGVRVRFELPVLHLPVKKKNSSRNLEIYRKWAGEEILHGRDLFYYGRELYYNRLYTEAAAVLTAFLEGDGWAVNKIDACRTLALCHRALGKREEAFHALFASFRYGEPRAFVLCEIGSLFFEEKRYREAAYWYECATTCADHSEEGDFEEAHCRTILPYLQLVVCYWALGDRERARLYHEKSLSAAPDHPSVRYNMRFFP